MSFKLGGFLFALILLSLQVLADPPVRRSAIYNCVFNEFHQEVTGLRVYESSLGNRKFFEVGVLVEEANVPKEVFYRVNLVSEYEGRVQTYGTGNLRVKINRVYPVEGKFRSFARLPAFNIHSQNWFCKDA